MWNTWLHEIHHLLISSLFSLICIQSVWVGATTTITWIHQMLLSSNDTLKKNQSKYFKEKPQFVKQTVDTFHKLPWRNVWISLNSNSVHCNLTPLVSNNITFYRFQLHSKKACHSLTKCRGSWGSCHAHLWLHWPLLFCCQAELPGLSPRPSWWSFSSNCFSPRFNCIKSEYNVYNRQFLIDLWILVPCCWE